jgi:AraC-like DNA-binding protein
MHVARGFHHESSGLMILTILSAPSVEAGLKTLVRYDKYIDPGIDTRLALNPDGCELSLTLLDPLNTERSQLNEYLITLLLQLLRTATRLDISPKEVRLQHAATRPKGALADFFDSPIHFNCERNALVFDNALLKETFVTSHQLLYSLLTKALQSYLSSTGEEHDFIDLVCREIIKQTEKETPNIETVANNLSMSVRTLRRHLSDEGYSFQDIKRVAKENQAKYFLTHTNMGQAEIAYELGYSEVSAFSRAFRSWTGETPQVYREKHTSE